MIVITKEDFYFGPIEPEDEFKEQLYTKSESIRTASTSDSLVSTSCEKIGWLQKQSNNILKNWNWRFFKLKDSRLIYYNKPSDAKPAGIVNFNQITVTLKVINPSKPTKLVLSFLGIPYPMSLKSPSPSELADWARHIQQHIDSSQGKIKELPLMNVGEKPWKHERVSEYYFRSTASTGDLVLFRSKDLGSKIQRGITGSSYDHVGMVLCYTSGKVCIFEALQGEGVIITEWDDFLANGWHKFPERIVFRKLKFERNEESLIRLDEFVRKVDGKAYKLSPKKIIGRSEKRAPGDENDFFCSELVASAYKSLGILPESIASSSFLPGSFAEDKKISLINASLESELWIDFNL